MSAQSTMGDWGPTEHVPGEGLDDDPTPRGVVGAVLRAAMCLDGHGWPVIGADMSDPYTETGLDLSPFGKTVRVLDVGAGYGCWSSEMRKLAQDEGWPVHITGVELNPAREEHLAKWCDEVVIRDWFDALRDHHELPTWDLIVGNPPFGQLLSGTAEQESAAADDGGWFADHGPPAPLGMPGWLLEHAPAVLLLHTQQAFLKSEAGRACWRRHPPAASWLVPGGVKFRGPGVGADSRCYQVTLWLRGHSGPCAVHLLDDLTAKERAWSVIPGSESPDVARALGLPMVGSTP